MDLVLNKLQRLICDKTQTNKYFESAIFVQLKNRYA